MKHPSKEEIAALKADAVKRFGSDRAVLYEIGSPVDQAIVMAPLDLSAWCTHCDASLRDTDTANASLLVDRLLWPSMEEGLALREKWGHLATTVGEEMHKTSGHVPGEPVIWPFSISSMPNGMTEEVAKLLPSGEELWTVVLPNGTTLVMQAPSTDVFLAARAADKTASTRNKDYVMSTLVFLRESIVWCAEPIDALLNRLPLITSDLRAAYMQMGGAGATVRSKSL